MSDARVNPAPTSRMPVCLAGKSSDTPFFCFLVRVDHYLRVFTGKAAGERKRAKNGNSKNLIHSQAFNLFANQPNFQFVI